MAASPQGVPSGRRAVITATPEARWPWPRETARSSWSRPCARSAAARRRCPQAYACRRGRGRCRGGRCAGGRRGSPRAPGGGGDQARERERVAEQLAQAGGRRAAARRGARAPRGWRRRGAATAGSASAGASGGRRRRIGERRQRRAAAEHEALGERVRGQPVGAVQAGAGALADRVEPGQRRAPVEVRWPPRPSCSARRARPGSRSRRGSIPTSPSAAAMFGKRATSTARMSSLTAGRAAALELRLDRERHLVARCQLVHEALAVLRRAAWRPRRARPR